MKKNCVTIVAVFAIAMIAACATKNNISENTIAGSDGPLAAADSLPIKLMPDTLRIIGGHPLIIRDRASSDSVQIFPYSLIFENAAFDTYIVSFTDATPTLITLDKEKSIIDSVVLIGRRLPASNGYRHFTHALIYAPDNIIVHDSIFTWDLKGTQRIPASKKVKVSQRRYKISSDGTIQ